MLCFVLQCCGFRNEPDVMSRGVGWLAGFAPARSFIETEISPLYHTGECPAATSSCVLPVNANVHLQYRGVGVLTDAVVTIDVYPKNITTATGKFTGLLHILLRNTTFLPIPWHFLCVRLSSVAATHPQSDEINRKSDRARRLFFGTDFQPSLHEDQSCVSERIRRVRFCYCSAR